MDSLKSDAFAVTQRHAASGVGKTHPRKSYREQPAVELSPQAASWLNERLERAFLMNGRLAAIELEQLDWVPALVFKGGTCLANVHAGFFRLSEDLDFSIPMSRDASRAQRSKAADRFKAALAELPDRISGFRLVEPCRGANNSTQYTATVGYNSRIEEREETISIEAGLREPLLTPSMAGLAQTLLLDPVTGQQIVPPVSLTCLSKVEAYAEKFRAALSRREAARRDYYDLDHAVREAGIDPEDSQLADLVRQKLAVAGNAAVDVSPERLASLRGQIEVHLRPVLRGAAFLRFDLERAFALAVDMAGRVR
jgi:predicted nucleotidyltransferase component of viral defense system